MVVPVLLQSSLVAIVLSGFALLFKIIQFKCTCFSIEINYEVNYARGQ
jgi:hypothetical protein